MSSVSVTRKAYAKHVADSGSWGFCLGACGADAGLQVRGSVKSCCSIQGEFRRAKTPELGTL